MADNLSKVERDKRLTALDTAVKEYGAEKEKRLNADVEFMQSVINSRTGAGQLVDQGILDAKNLLVESIKQFLEG